MRRTRLGLSLTLGLTALLGPLAAAPAGAAPGPRTVVPGLGGPLHLAYDRGALFVADTFAGQVLKVDPATGRKRVLASGISASAVSVGTGGRVFASIWVEGTTPSLVRVTPGGTRVVADLLAFEKRNNPDGQPQVGPDALSNPYDVLAQDGRVLVADAAANSILSVTESGRVRVLTVLPVSRKGACATATNNGVPNGGCDPVPTAMAVGPDGYLYVSGLGAEVEGHVWKIEQSSGRIVAHWDGLPPLTGIAVGNYGAVYVSSLFANTVLRLSPRGDVVGSARVTGPTDVAVQNGQLYAGSVVLGPAGPAGGSVVRLPVTALGGT